MGDRSRSVDVTPHLRAGTSEIEDSRAVFAVDGDLQPNHGAVVHHILGIQYASSRFVLGFLAKGLEDLPDGHFSVFLYVVHVSLNDIEAIRVNELGYQLNASLIGGNLGPEVRQVVRQKSSSRTPRVLAWSLESGNQRFLLPLAFINNFETFESCSFLPIK